MSFQLKIKGVMMVNQYDFINTTNGFKTHLIVLGENHLYKGNGPHFLKLLVEKTNCPIHVLNEMWKTYENSNYDNNVCSISNNYNNCFTRYNIPKENKEELLDTKNIDYFKQCIQPFQGKVKFWNIDMRANFFFNDIFYLIYDHFEELLDKCPLLSIVRYNNRVFKTYETAKNHLDPKIKSYLDNILDLHEILFDTMLYFNNLKEYNKKLLDKLKMFKGIENNILYKFLLNQANQFDSNQIYMYHYEKTEMKYKNHTYLLDKLNNLSSQTIESIFKTMRNKTPTVLITDTLFMDIYALIKIIELIRNASCHQYIIYFCGACHAFILNEFLKIQNLFQYKEEQHNPIITQSFKNGYNKYQSSDYLQIFSLFRKNEYTMTIPQLIIKEDEKTQRMKAYDQSRNFYKKKKIKHASTDIVPYSSFEFLKKLCFIII